MQSMSGYTKLFNSILASTIWRAPNETRIVWITMLAMADRDGIVEASIPGLADFARVPVEACRVALDELSAPDPDSRSKDEDGRRIEAIDGGWRLINHPKYRAKMNADERRNYLRVKQAERRQRRKQLSTNVNNVSDKSTLSTHAEAEAKADTKEELKNVSAASLRDTTPAPGVLVFETVGRGPKSWALTSTQIAEWATAYPGIDVLGECRKAQAWVKANQRKTASGMPRFSLTWLNRATNAGHWRRPVADTSAASQPDARGHIPPCRTHTECNRKLEQEIAQRKGATA